MRKRYAATALFTGAFAGAMITLQWPEIHRYIKMTRM